MTSSRKENEMGVVRVLFVILSYNFYGGVVSNFYALCKNIDRSRFQIDALIACEPDADGLDVLRDAGCNIHIIPPRSMKAFYSRVRDLKRFFAENKGRYDVVHLEQSDFDTAPLLHYAKKAGCKVRIIHGHNMTPSGKYGLIFKFLVPFNNLFATSFCACSPDVGKVYFGSHSFHWVKNGVDLERFGSVTDEQIEAVRNELRLSADNLVLGAVGRFVPEKNMERIVDIFQCVLAKEPRARLVLVGDGPLFSAVKDKVKRLGLEDKVSLTGRRTDVPVLLRLMRLLVVPSDFEGFPCVLTEALASSARCLISDSVVSPDFEGRISFCPLKETNENWADREIELLRAPRLNDGIDFIRREGFDVVDSAKDLGDFYLEQLRESSK